MKKTILRVVLLINTIFIIVLLVHLGQRIFLTPKLPRKDIPSGISIPKKTSESQKITSSVPPQTTTAIVKRNILFQYRDSRPKKVEIVSDFNNWIPTEMIKGPNYTWTIICRLEPGEYTYKFLVDGRLKKDPYNLRSTPDGYGGESSLLVVKPIK